MIAPTLLPRLAAPTSGGVTPAASGAGDLFAALLTGSSAPAIAAGNGPVVPPAATAPAGQALAVTGMILPPVATDAGLSSPLEPVVTMGVLAVPTVAPPARDVLPMLMRASGVPAALPPASMPITVAGMAAAIMPAPAAPPDGRRETGSSTADQDDDVDDASSPDPAAAIPVGQLGHAAMLPPLIVAAPPSLPLSSGSSSSSGSTAAPPSGSALAFQADVLNGPVAVDAQLRTDMPSSAPGATDPVQAVAATPIAPAPAAVAAAPLPTAFPSPSVVAPDMPPPSFAAMAAATPAPAIAAAASPIASGAGDPPATAAATSSSIAPTQTGSVAATPPPIAVLPAPPAPVVGAAAPARQLFAAAIEAADRQDRAAGRPVDAAAGTVAATPLAPPLHAVAGAVSTGGQQGLDMRRNDWPAAMVDHIERLRDAVDATDTRIRLVPDALGSIDVAISRQPDGVHVALHADQAATQALLADARPQLVDLAGTRGLRLADASTGGDASAFAGQHRQPTPRASSAPVSTDPDPDDTDPADGRIA